MTYIDINNYNGQTPFLAAKEDIQGLLETKHTYLIVRGWRRDYYDKSSHTSCMEFASLIFVDVSTNPTPTSNYPSHPSQIHRRFTLLLDISSQSERGEHDSRLTAPGDTMLMHNYARGYE